MASLADILSGVLGLIGTPVPATPQNPNQAAPPAPPAPPTRSYAPFIESGLMGLAGLLGPQGGRRTWAGALGNALAGGVEGYNAGQDLIRKRQDEATNALLNQQKLASGALALRSNENLMKQFGTINPEAIKFSQAKQQALHFATGAKQFAADPTLPADMRAAYARAASIAEQTQSMDAATKLMSMDKSMAEAALARGKLTLQPLEEKQKEAQIAHEQASTAHLNRLDSGARTAGTAGTPGDRPMTALGEARREYQMDTTDRLTGLPKEDAPSFDDWLATEWPKRRAAISGTARTGVESSSSDTLSRSSTPEPAPPLLPVPGIGTGRLVGTDKKGRPLYEFPDGTIRARNPNKKD